ncbi:MAG: DNA alkylation repair protein [Deltaproteobacteria bacterium]|nr:DNA alkylation repair protein [Deltaproteobacteria bacterium]
METRAPAKRAARAPRARVPFADAMAELEAAGSAQTLKTYRRHRVTGPCFGVSFATLKLMMKRIDVDHELALALWDTGNFDARNLAVKVVDPSRMSEADLDRWASEASAAIGCATYVAGLAAEGPFGPSRARAWLGSTDLALLRAGWSLVGQLAARDETLPDAFFLERLAEIERLIPTAENSIRSGMNNALIEIGQRNPALRGAALAAAARIGRVEVDHGDTDCKTPAAAASIAKAWAHAEAKGFASPAAQERKRDLPRRRC